MFLPRKAPFRCFHVISAMKRMSRRLPNSFHEASPAHPSEVHPTEKREEPFFIAVFFNGRTISILSGLNFSAMTGDSKPSSFQTENMLGIPLPARSPISMRLNIFMIVLFLGSEMPPTFAASTSIRNLPCLHIMVVHEDGAEQAHLSLHEVPCKANGQKMLASA